MSLVLSLFLTAALQQGATPPGPPPPPESSSWWDQQTPEQREKMRQRMDAYRQMPEEARTELKRRRELVKKERTDILENLSEEEQAGYQALDKHEQRRFLDERLRTRLEAQGKELRIRFPDAEALQGHGDFSERFRESRRFLSKERGEQIRKEIAKAVEDGWLGPRTANWLERAGIEESMAVLGEVRKWQFIERASEEGFWEQEEIDEARRGELLRLPPPEFFRAVRGMMPRDPRFGPGPRGGGPPEDHRAGAGRPGEGHPGAGRPGEGRPGDGGPPPRRGDRHHSPPPPPGGGR